MNTLTYETVPQYKKLIIENFKDFEPRHIFDCGQSFRWYAEEDGSYTGIAYGKVLNVKKDGEDIILSNTDETEFKDIWYHYFDLGRDYGEIKQILSQDPILKRAIEFGEGIRILRQDEWEILISFIISANNRIPMIKKTIRMISERWGKAVEYNGKVYYTFPDPCSLSGASLEELEECGTGFRAGYIKRTAELILNGYIDLYNLRDIGYAEAREELIKLPGVGPKVSDCILLFSMGYSEAFPVDVWIKRVMQHFYLTPDVSLKKIEEYAQDRFRELAGFAQEYLFYYARDLKLKEADR